MKTPPACPGCQYRLEVIAEAGRADDLYLCSRCYHSWFAFELEQPSGLEAAVDLGDDAEER